MSSGDPTEAWQRRSRIGLSLFYGLASVLHIVWPAPFLSITPRWAPLPDAANFLTVVSELAGEQRGYESGGREQQRQLVWRYMRSASIQRISSMQSIACP